MTDRPTPEQLVQELDDEGGFASDLMDMLGRHGYVIVSRRPPMTDRPTNIHGDPLTPIVLDTNQGGIRTYLCACGAFIHHEMWSRHLSTCPSLEATDE